VQETVPSNLILASIAISPSVAGTTSLATATADVTVVAGGTTVKFTDFRPVVLTLCKVAGSGIEPGTPFTITFAGHQVTVAAGAPPTGNCASPVMLAPGTTFTITETASVPSHFQIVGSEFAACPGGRGFLDPTSNTITTFGQIPGPCTIVVTNAAGAE
jgi:hypothetical protein